jgi:hypothetical protein
MYIYAVEESSVDVRHYTITCKEELLDDSDLILDAICQIGIPKDNTTETVKLENGQEVEVTFNYTEYGDDSQVVYEVCNE